MGTPLILSPTQNALTPLLSSPPQTILILKHRLQTSPTAGAAASAQPDRATLLRAPTCSQQWGSISANQQILSADTWQTKQTLSSPTSHLNHKQPELQRPPGATAITDGREALRISSSNNNDNEKALKTKQKRLI